VNAEAAASNAPRPPEITTLDHYPLNRNDPEATKRVADAFRTHFSAERARRPPARISDRSGRNGKFPPCFGSWAAPIPLSTPRRRKRGDSTSCRSITVRSTPPSFIRRCGPASKRWSSRHRLGFRQPDRGKRLEMSLLLVLDLIGTFVFAISGATAGVKRRLDLFGVLVLSFVAGNF